MKKEVVFRFWFHASFVDGSVMELSKAELDILPYESELISISNNFTVKLHFKEERTTKSSFEKSLEIDYTKIEDEIFQTPKTVRSFDFEDFLKNQSGTEKRLSSPFESGSTNGISPNFNERALSAKETNSVVRCDEVSPKMVKFRLEQRPGLNCLKKCDLQKFNLSLQYLLKK